MEAPEKEEPRNLKLLKKLLREAPPNNDDNQNPKPEN